MKKLLLTLSAMVLSIASFASISGPHVACSGSSILYADSGLTGGVWSSSNPSVATIDAATGVAVGLTTGVTTISYTTALATDVLTLSVNATPTAITASATSVCVGSTITVSNATPGGTWTSATSWIATVDASGHVGGAYPGVAEIRYVNSAGCYASISVTVSGTYLDPIMVPSTVCVGSVITAIDSSAGGTWTSSNPSIATVSSTGSTIAMITGVSLGTVTITYTVPSTGCGTLSTTANVSVINTTDPGTISGASSVVAGSSIYLSETVSGGSWSLAPSSVATINALGMVTGLTAGSAIATYTVSGCGGVASTTYPITVTAFDGIAGDISFGSFHYGSVKVWLITLTGTTLAAVDSTVVLCSGTSVHYQFGSEPTNAYRVKAATPDSASFTGWTGFVPTYHTSSFYWNTADVLSHTSGTGDLGVNINMMTGSVTSGPGFIGGDVTTGANKGTTTGAPVVGLMMYCVDNATGALYQAVRTNAAGHYSFSNLPIGVYKIFPDSLNYTTVTYDNINITATSTSYNAASFVQHTLSHVISPVPVGVNNVNGANASIVAAPNPTTGMVSIKWNIATAQHATVVVTDVTGRVVANNAIDMTAGAGSSDLNLTNLVSGMYTISVKSAEISYTTKVQVQH